MKEQKVQYYESNDVVNLAVAVVTVQVVQVQRSSSKPKKHSHSLAKAKLFVDTELLQFTKTLI